MAVGYSSMDSSNYICLDQEQWHYQALKHMAATVRRQDGLKSVSVGEMSELGRINKLINPVPYSVFIASNLNEASEQLVLIARDISSGIDALTNAYYSSIRSAIEQLSTALVLLEYGDTEAKCKLMLNLYAEDHKREIEHLGRLSTRSFSTIMDHREASIEEAAMLANMSRAERLKATYAGRQEYLTRKYPKYLSGFNWRTKRTVTEIVGLADEVVVGRIRKPVLCGNILSVWGICSGQVHGKLWSSKTLSKLVHDDGWVHNGGEDWVEVPFVNSKPDVAMLSSVYEFAVELYYIALKSYYSRI